MLRIDDAPGHRRRARSVLLHEAHRMQAGLGIEHVVDVALPPDRDVLAAMFRDLGVAHALCGHQLLPRLLTQRVKLALLLSLLAYYRQVQESLFPSLFT